jgi:hypothetical protein
MMVMALLALLILYFLVKKVLKLVLIFGILLLLVAGYVYYQAPDDFSHRLQDTVQKVKDGTGTFVEKGKGVIEKGKDFAHKVDRVVDKGSEFIADKKEALKGD